MDRRKFLAGAAAFGSVPLIAPVMADTRTIQLVYFHNYPPFSWDSGDGMQGILIDLLTEVLEKRMGIQTSHTGYPWKRAQLQVKIGLADAFCTVPTPERESYTLISKEPTMLATFTPFIQRYTKRRADLQAIKNLNDLQNFRVGLYLGSGWAKKNLKDRGLDLVETSTLDSTLAMLAADRIDLVIDTSQVLRYRVRELGMQSMLEELPQVLDQAPFSLCIGQNSDFAKIMPAFEEEMRKLRSESRYDAIMGNYS